MAISARQLESELRVFSRRGLLKGCLAIGAGISVLGVSGCSSPSPPSGVLLGGDDARVIVRLAHLMFPDDGRLFPVEQVNVVKNVGHLIDMLDAAVREDVLAAIKLFEYGALVHGWHLSRFSSLAANHAVSYCDQWQNGNELQRAIVSVLKKLIYTGYWQDPRAWAPVDFDGPVSEKWRLEKLGNAALPEGE